MRRQSRTFRIDAEHTERFGYGDSGAFCQRACRVALHCDSLDGACVCACARDGDAAQNGAATAAHQCDPRFVQARSSWMFSRRPLEQQANKQGRSSINERSDERAAQTGLTKDGQHHRFVLARQRRLLHVHRALLDPLRQVVVDALHVSRKRLRSNTASQSDGQKVTERSELGDRDRLRE